MGETSGKFRRRITFVECLTLLIVFGILSAVIVPRFTRISSDAANNELEATVRAVRTQIDLYKREHAGQLPDVASVAVHVPGAAIKNGIAIGSDVAFAFVYDYGTAGDGTGRFWGVDRDSNGLPILVGD